MARRFKISISTKLVVGTILTIVCTMAPIAIISSGETEENFLQFQKDANGELSNSKALEVDQLVYKYLEKVRTVTDLLADRVAEPTSSHA